MIKITIEGDDVNALQQQFKLLTDVLATSARAQLPKKPVRRPPDVQSVQRQAPPETLSTSPDEAMDVDMDEVEGEAEDEVLPQVNGTAPGSTADAMRLKEETIALLQAAFTQGKVKQVQQVLRNHGMGAKSFREIDISSFPKIAEAIAKGALN
jgi:hypothetical protein